MYLPTHATAPMKQCHNVVASGIRVYCGVSPLQSSSLFLADRTTRSMIGYCYLHDIVVCLTVCLSLTLCIVCINDASFSKNV